MELKENDRIAGDQSVPINRAITVTIKRALM